MKTGDGERGKCEAKYWPKRGEAEEERKGEGAMRYNGSEHRCLCPLPLPPALWIVESRTVHPIYLPDVACWWLPPRNKTVQISLRSVWEGNTLHGVLNRGREQEDEEKEDESVHGDLQ